MQTETGAYVIDDQGGAGAIADLAGAACECRRRHFLVTADIVAERGDDDAREVVTGRIRRGLQAGDVVVVEMHDVRTIFRGDPR